VTVTTGVLSDPREALVDALLEVAPQEDRLVVLDADVSRTSRTRRFRDAFPQRFYDVGVAEQNLFGIAAGLAATGRIPVAVTFAIFASLRAAEPIRTSICYPRFNVKIIGGYAGLSNGKDGATHQSLEDVAIMRSFANLVVLSPSDAVMTRKMLRAAVEHVGPVYIRLEYENVPRLYDETLQFAIGRGYRLQAGTDVTVAAYGLATHRALAAATTLADEGIAVEVLDLPTLKPLDTALLLASVRKTGALVTVEDHSLIGGLASAASDCLVAAGVSPRVRRLGIADVFTESGSSAALREKYGVGLGAIQEAVRAVAKGV
jgi:transketolase